MSDEDAGVLVQTGGAVAIALKYSLTIGKAPTDNVKVGTFWETPEKPSQAVVDIRENFAALNRAFAQIELDIKKVKQGYEGNLPTKIDGFDTALKELSTRKVGNNPTERRTMLDDIATETENAREISADIAEAIRIGNLIKPDLKVGGQIRVLAGKPITVGMLGASIKPSLSLKVMHEGQELGPTGFPTPGKRTVRVVFERTTTHDGADKPVEVDVYVIKPVITVGDDVSVPIGTKITPTLLGASVSDSLELKVLYRGKELDDEGFPTPGERTLTLVCEASPSNEHAEATVKAKVVFRKREISFTPLVAPVVWGTRITRELLKARATGESAEVQVVEPSALVIGANSFTLRAEGNKKQCWNDADEKPATVTFFKIPRTITLSPPKNVPGNTKVTPADVGAVLWDGAPNTGTQSKAAMKVSEPADGVLRATGKQITVTVTADELTHYGLAAKSCQIAVTKSKPKLVWAKPAPVALDKDDEFKLGATQLNTTVTPANFADEPVYDPAADEVITKIGVHRLAATLAATPGSEAATASVVLTVVKNAVALRGMKEMNSGEAFKKPTKPGKGDDSDGSYERWEEWQTSGVTDPNAVGTMGKRVLAEVSLMKPNELYAYMKNLKDEDDKLDVDKRQVSAWRDERGKKLISFKNGLEIRYKPNGDKHTGGKPCFCLEVRKNPALPEAGGQAGIAFKVTSDGKPAAKGPSQLKYPSNFMAEAQLDYKDGAMAATHLRLMS